MKTMCAIAVLLFCLTLAVPASATLQDQLDTAVRHGEVAFVLVRDSGAAGLDKTRSVIREAMAQVEGSTLIELDRSNAANAAIVARYRVAGAPVPLILILAPNGAIAGGLRGVKATPDALIKLVPSPKKAEILQAVQSGKAVFLVATRKTMSSQSEVARTCAIACQQMGNKAVTVRVDLGDEAEASFLRQIGINPASPSPVTKVINPQGQVSATYVGSVDTAALVQNALKPVSSGCCPTGSGKSCGPTKNQ